jgi:hypothetical protein
MNEVVDGSRTAASRLEGRRFRGFNAEEFREEGFDALAFVRRFGGGGGGGASLGEHGEHGAQGGSLSDLKADLSTHLGAIQGDLLALVHRDYADFVRLSTELEGVDAMLMECRRPVLELRKNARQLREAAAHALEQLQSGTGRNAQLQSEAAHLELSMRALRVLQLAERLVAGGMATVGQAGRGGGGGGKGATFSSSGHNFEAYASALLSSADMSDDSDSEDDDADGKKNTNRASAHGSLQEQDVQPEGIYRNDSRTIVPGRDAEESTLEECATLERAARLLSHVRALQGDMRSSHAALVTAAKAAGGLTAADLLRSLGQEYEHVDAFINLRARRLEEHLLGRLEIAYGSEIVPDILAGGGYRGAMNVNTDAVSYCLRAYSCLGAGHARAGSDNDETEFQQARGGVKSRGAVGRAASVFARLVMEPFLAELLTLGNLDGGMSSSSTSTSASNFSGVSNRGSCAGLPTILAKLCTFVQTQCSVVLKVLRSVKSEMAEELLHASGGAVAIKDTDSNSNNDDVGNDYDNNNDRMTDPADAAFAVDILSNGIWNPIAKAIEDKFGAQLFSFAQPDRFHRNFSACKRFLEQDLPHAAGATPGEREHLRSHAATAHFWSRWSLPIYFGLRKKGLVGALEKAMLLFAAADGQGHRHGWKLVDGAQGPGRVATECMKRCWDRDTVFLDWLAPRFFQLSLELSGKYTSWFESKVREFGKQAIGSGQVDAVRWGPPLHADMEMLASALTSTLAEHAVSALSDNGTDAAGSNSGWQADAAEAIHAAFAECASRMRSAGIKIWDVYIEALVQQCTVFSSSTAATAAADKKIKNKKATKTDGGKDAASAARAAVKAAGLEVKSLDSMSTRVDGIARTFRFASSRPLPTDPSDYVALLTMPLWDAAADRQGMRAAPPKVVARVVESVLARVAGKFRQCLEGMVEGARKTEASLRRVKKMASSSARSGSSSDLTKIVTQVGIDVGRFAEDAENVARSVEGGGGRDLPVEVEELRRWASGLL